MTRAGTRQVGGARSWRALVAVFALYGLVLQAMFGGAAALASPSPFDVICAAQGDGTDAPGKNAPAHHHTGCCTLGHAAAALEPPAAVVHVIAWPPRRAARPVRHADGAVAARAPPESPASPRAPPVV